MRKHNCGAGEIEEGEVAPDPDAKAPPPPAVAEHQNLNRHEIEIEGKKINDTDKRNNGGVGAAQVPTSNGADNADDGHVRPGRKKGSRAHHFYLAA